MRRTDRPRFRSLGAVQTGALCGVRGEYRRRRLLHRIRAALRRQRGLPLAALLRDWLPCVRELLLPHTRLNK